MASLNIKGSISIMLFNKCFSIISSSKLIFNFFFSLSYKLEIKLNTFLAYKLEADTGNLFNMLAS